ncbi:MAG: hypothetical protein IT318_16120 [Anaerolineales bacterium]|nr:hypothetical protein [Anaerolineales bacterium]
MTRKVTPSQLRSILRQAEQKRRQAIDKYNQAARKYNQQTKQAVADYNRAVRAHNSHVRANRQRINNELAKLRRQSNTTQHVVFRVSVSTMHEAYVRLENRAESQNLGSYYGEVLDLSEQETANSLRVMNSLLGTGSEPEDVPDDVQTVRLADQLRKISPDLDDKWRGAVFSLNARNPDAARHFCTSAREIFTKILEIRAPDETVINQLPECERTQQGKPTRRAKIKFFLHQKGMLDGELEEFVEQDMENIVQLFQVLNDGAHGSAGKFDMQQLASIRKRVEDGMLFLAHLVN